MASVRDLDEQMADLGIEEEENEELVFDEDVEEINKYELCLVGRFLSDKAVNNRAMKSKLADIWRPALGITIKEIETGSYLFQFYHKEDMQWVINGGPWMFDNMMLLLESIPSGKSLTKVSLCFLNIWIQVYDIPSGFMTATVGKQLGNFFGEFLMYDQKNDSSLWREYMRIKIKLDTRKPLKRKKKIMCKNGKEFTVNCKYERLGDFCFVCGMISHTERFCKRFLTNRNDELNREWGTWLRAPQRRVAGQNTSKWLREDGEVDWEVRNGKSNKQASFGGEDNGKETYQEGNDRGGLTAAKNKEIMVIPAGRISNNLAPEDVGFILDGPGGSNLNGLGSIEKKRRRGELEAHTILYAGDGSNMRVYENSEFHKSDATLSEMDCAVSSNQVLATLTVQASQSK